MKRKKSDPANICCVSLPIRARAGRRLYVTCPKLSPVVTHRENLEEAQANTREAIELCLEVMRADGQPIPAPDPQLTAPIKELVPVAVVDI